MSGLGGQRSLGPWAIWNPPPDQFSPGNAVDTTRPQARYTDALLRSARAVQEALPDLGHRHLGTGP